MTLKNKRILITAGPTWVPIDRVRVISNIASGATGILLAQGLIRQGAKVTLLLGPQGACCLDKKIKLIPFIFFRDLKKSLAGELSRKKYDIVIHTAAVSDYEPKGIFRGKVKSGIKEWVLRLRPTVKIIDLIKKSDPAVYLAGFKFHPDAAKDTLVKESTALIRHSRADLVVANTVDKNGYSAYIVGKDINGPFKSKSVMAKQLIRCLSLI